MFNSFKISKFLLYLVPLMIVIVTSSTLFPFIVGKYVYFRIVVDLAFIFFLLGILLDQRGSDEILKRLKELTKNPLAIAVSVFIFFFLIAGIFGVNPANSFWSNFERGEGGLQLLHFYVFFGLLALLFREEKDWQAIFMMMIVGLIGIGFYGTAASLKSFSADADGAGGPFSNIFQSFIGPSFSTPGFRFEGSIGNSSYVAAYAIFALFYAVYLLISKYWGRLFSFGAIILWILALLTFAIFMMSGTRGAFIGLIASVLAFLAYLSFSSKRWRKWLVLAGAVIVVLIVLLAQFKDTAFIKSIPGVSRILSISLTAETFQDRLTIWKIAVDGFKERPILGWGPENFIEVFDRHFNTEYFVPAEGFGAWFDRAHNIYLDYLAETGILGLLSYLAIFIVFYWQLLARPRVNSGNNQAVVDKKSILANALIFSIPVAYLVQGLVLFDVSPIYLNLFLIFAFGAYKYNIKSQNV